MEISIDRTKLIKIMPQDIDENGVFRVPETVTELGDKVVSGGEALRRLKKIHLNNVEKIGESAFEGCENLETVIGAPKYVGHRAFMTCVKLAEIDLSNTNKIGSYAFYRAGLTEADISNIKIIEDYAFHGCRNLKKVIGSPVSFGIDSFGECEKLTNIDLSKAIAISLYTFRRSGLIEIDISSLEKLPPYAFSECHQLERVKGAPKYLRERAFFKCGKLIEFDFSNIESMEVGAFLFSGLQDCIKAMNKTIEVVFGERTFAYARLNRAFRNIHRISSVIDQNKNAYIGTDGIPFIINKENKPIRMSDDKEQFMNLLSGKKES